MTANTHAWRYPVFSIKSLLLIVTVMASFLGGWAVHRSQTDRLFSFEQSKNRELTFSWGGQPARDFQRKVDELFPDLRLNVHAEPRLIGTESKLWVEVVELGAVELAKQADLQYAELIRKAASEVHPLVKQEMVVVFFPASHQVYFE